MHLFHHQWPPSPSSPIPCLSSRQEFYFSYHHCHERSWCSHFSNCTHQLGLIFGSSSWGALISASGCPLKCWRIWGMELGSPWQQSTFMQPIKRTFWPWFHWVFLFSDQFAHEIWFWPLSLPSSHIALCSQLPMMVVLLCVWFCADPALPPCALPVLPLDLDIIISFSVF